MGCAASSESVVVDNRSGLKYDCMLQKWCKGWKDVYVQVYKDSEIYWYNKKGDNYAIGKVVLKKVAQFLAVGPYADRMPNRPTLPSGGQIDYLIAFPDYPSRDAPVNWLLLKNDNQLGQLMSALCAVLPPPPKQRPPQQPQQPQGGHRGPPPPYGSTAAPPAYQAQAMPQQGYNMNQMGGYPPQQQGGYPPQQQGGYPPQQQQGGYRPPPHQQQNRVYPQQQGGGGGTTVIVQDRGRRHSGGSLDGLAAGMLLGAAMGGPRWGWGYCPGWGYGGWGHHGHFDSHMHNSTEINNTYITNETIT